MQLWVSWHQSLHQSAFPLVLSAYGSSSCLFFGEDIILSSEGVQQGDPLGPLLFCLAIHGLVHQLQSVLNVFYLDDGTLGGGMEVVLQDFETMEQMTGELGLSHNQGKSEIIYDDSNTRNAMLHAVPGLSVVDQNNTSLLGSPVGNVDCIS